MIESNDSKTSNSDRSLHVEQPADAPVNVTEYLQAIYDRAWNPMIRSEYFADVIPGWHEYHVLKVKGELYLFAEDIARQAEMTVLEVMDFCGHGNEVYYPAPGIPHPLCNALPGAYVPFSRGMKLIRSHPDSCYDRYELGEFRDEFARRMQEG